MIAYLLGGPHDLTKLAVREALPTLEMARCSPIDNSMQVEPDEHATNLRFQVDYYRQVPVGRPGFLVYVWEELL